MKKSLGGVALAMVLAAIGIPGAQPAGATSLTYTVTNWSRSVEGFAQIPAEATQASPSGIVGLANQGRATCHGIAGIYDLGVVDGYLGLSVNGYQNPTRMEVANPEDRRPTHAEIGSAPGPRAVADCSTPTSGTASSTWGGHVADQFSVESATSRSTSQREGDEPVVVTEATTKLEGIHVGDASIRSFESWLKTEWQAGREEPLVSYRIVLTGLFDKTKEVATGGGNGVTLTGEAVGGSDLVRQFNEQAKAHAADLQQLGTYGFTLMTPHAGHDRTIRDVMTSGGWTVEAPVLAASWGFTARKGQTGHRQGVRLGLNRVVGHISWDQD
jgi:hypothetical protein